MAYSQEIKEYTKELFLIPDNKGNKKYSTRQISNKIKQDMGIKINHSTVAEWAKRGEWEQLWIKGVRAGFLEAAEKEKEADRIKNKSQEEKIKEAISNAVRSRRLQVIQMLNKSNRYYDTDKKKQQYEADGEYVPTNPTEAFSLWKYCMDELKIMEEVQENTLTIGSTIHGDVNLKILNEKEDQLNRLRRIEEDGSNLFNIPKPKFDSGIEKDSPE